MKAFVAGATGATGSRIVKQLVSRGVPVVAFVRDAAAARSQLPIEVTLAEGDVTDKDSIRRAITLEGRSSTSGGCTVLISATGARPGFDPTAPYQVDFEGNKNLIDVAKETGIEHFVMVSSLCVSRFFHPLNLFFLILYWKQQAEAYLQASGLTYTIVRPGGLKDDDTDSRALIMAPADTLFEGSVSRQKVAQVCVEALYLPQSRDKIVEIVAQENANPQPYEALFAGVA